MNYLIKKPKSIRYKDLVKLNSLSPIRYREYVIKNKKRKKLKDFLDINEPIIKGYEPGSKNYIEKSSIGYIRNSCIKSNNFMIDNKKLLYLKPIKKKIRDKSLILKEGDILLAKDANIGDCIIIDSDFIKNKETRIERYSISSGIVKLNLNEEEINPLYLFAFLKSPLLENQLRILTGKGSTITHAKSLYMGCEIPLPRNKKEEMLVSKLCQLLILKESIIKKKWQKIMEIIDNELSNHNAPFTYLYPTYLDIVRNRRLDASFYSFKYLKYLHDLENYKKGICSVEDLGFLPKRGPSLSVRDSGRMIYSRKRINKNFWIVIKPKYLSDYGTIDEFIFMANRQPKWSFKKGDVLFSAEGTIGKIFIFCEDIENITTNYHGIMISHEDVNESIILGCFLGYLQEIGVLDKISVGGQGGSLSLSHWDYLKITDFKDSVKQKIIKLYHQNIIPNYINSKNPIIENLNYHIKNINSFGIFEQDYQLRFFKSLLNEIIYKITNDEVINETIVLNSLKNLNFQNSFEKVQC